MATLITIIVLFLILAIYAFSSYIYNRQYFPVIEDVEAGPLDFIEKQKEETEKDNLKPLMVKDEVLTTSKDIVKISDYKQFRVKGNCMRNRGIESGDIILAHIFKSDTEKEQLKKDDILLIYIDDERYRGYKIRIFDKYSELSKNLLKTYCYTDEGEIHYSKRDHNIKNVFGIVKMKITKSE